MTFIEALNNEETKKLIEQIEDLADTQDEDLKEVRKELIKELETKGYKWKN